MNNEFKQISKGDITRYVLESGSSGGTSSGSVASVSMPIGGTRKRGANLIAQEADKKTVPATTPRNFVAKNAKSSGAGAHKDKKKAAKQGQEKHKKPFMEDHSTASGGWGKGSYDTYTAGNHGRGVAEDERDHPDHEIQMASSELLSIAKNAEELLGLVRRYSEQEGLDAWQQSKITKAADYLNSVLQSVNGEQQGVAEGSETSQQQQVRAAITKGMEKWDSNNKSTYQSQPTKTNYMPPSGYASDSLTGVDSIDPDGTVVISLGNTGAEATIKKLATLGGMPGIKTRQLQSPTVSSRGVAEGLPGSLSKSDYTPGPRGTNLPSMPTKKFFTDKKQWMQAVDDINHSKYDDNSEYTGETGRSTVTIDGREWARWSDAQQKGYIDMGSMTEGEEKRCMQCGMTDCTCPPGKCKCKPVAGWIPNKGFKKDVDESWDDIKKFGKKAAVAGAIGLGIGAAHAGGWSPSDVPAGGHNQLPDIVAHVKFKVGDKEVSKEINLGSHYRSPGEAGKELENFLKSKGIKFYEYSLERVKPKDDDKMDSSPATGDMKGSMDTKEPAATGPSTDNYMAKDNDPEHGPSMGGKFVKEDPYFESLQSMVERQLEPTMNLDSWIDNFQNADPNKYHQFKNKTPEKKKVMATAALYKARQPKVKKQ